MQQHDSIEFDSRSPSPTTQGNGAKRSKLFFLEHGHVADHIKGNHEMQQHGSKKFAHRPPPPPTADGTNRSKFIL